MLVEVRMQLLQLLLRHLDLLEAGGDLLEREIAALATLRDERAELLDVGERSVGLRRLENHLFLCAQASLLRCDCMEAEGMTSSQTRDKSYVLRRGVCRDGLSQCCQGLRGPRASSLWPVDL